MIVDDYEFDLLDQEQVSDKFNFLFFNSIDWDGRSLATGISKLISNSDYYNIKDN